jgi:hypothetical protein
MSNSRRTFLKTGLMATALVAVPAHKLLGQGKKDPKPPTDPLFNYNKTTFLYYVNSVFELIAPTGTVQVVLQRVDDMPAPAGGEAFSLLFRGGSTALEQDVYGIRHGALGSFNLLLVPTGADQNGAQGYLATLNRLSLVEWSKPPGKGRP